VKVKSKKIKNNYKKNTGYVRKGIAITKAASVTLINKMCPWAPSFCIRMKKRWWRMHCHSIKIVIPPRE
jgi:hypothetical protein